MSVPCQNDIKNDPQRHIDDTSALPLHDTEVIDQQYTLPYSLIRHKPERSACTSPESHIQSAIELFSNRSVTRAGEIIQEQSSRNTERAYKGDLMYWQAWLNAIGHSFNEVVSESKIIAFIVQHAEGLDPEIDAQLIAGGFKNKLGPHKLSTIKRRIASLSVFLDGVKWENHCHSKSIRYLLQKLTKKYGSSRPAGKAITKDICNYQPGIN